jgi:hypothetical protein
VELLEPENLLEDADGLHVFALNDIIKQGGTSDWNCLAESSSFLSSAMS